MKKLSALLLLAVLATGEELKIIAESFDADESKGISHFTGNVQIKKGSDELNASNVTIYTDEKRRPSKYVAQGDVSFVIHMENNDTYVGQAQKAVFLPQEKEYRFYTDVHLKQLNELKQIDGDEVIVSTLKGRAVAKGGAKKPVIMTFQLDDEEEVK